MTSTTYTLAWRNIWRHPRRTLLTIGAMVFADILLVFMLGLQLGQYRMMIDNSLALVSGQMQVQTTGYLDDPQMYRSIPEADQLAVQIRKAINLEAVSPRAYGFALVSSEKRTLGVQISGVEPYYEQLISTIPGLISSGRYLSSADANEAVIGSTLARNLKLAAGDELTLLGSGRDGSMAAAVLPVVGIFNTGNRDIDRQIIAIPLDSFRQIFSMGNDAHSIIIGGQRDREEQYKKAISTLIKDRDKLVLLDWETLLPGLKQVIEADFFSAWFMYAVLIILVAFSMLNTILMSVLERTHEFGILLALGVRHSKLGRIILTESTLIALTGMIIGIVAGSLLTFYFSKTGISYPGMEEMSARFNLPPLILPEVSLRTVIPGPLAVFLASVLSSLYPVWHMRKLNPVQAMQAA
ncbi:MAG: ABC transporter permease [Gammaproteobacteria bacterium]|nr:ABC transporter permease [Gammaproteobacteria bacterium]